MTESYPLLKPLTDQLMKEVRAYGILEVSTEQYQNVCNSIIRFAESIQLDSYSPELMCFYKDDLEKRSSAGEICKGYHRFRLRVIRTLSSLAESGAVDFSNTKSRSHKYNVSDEKVILIEKILNNYPISDATKNDLRAPTRHFLWYAQQQGLDPKSIDDPIGISKISAYGSSMYTEPVTYDIDSQNELLMVAEDTVPYGK